MEDDSVETGSEPSRPGSGTAQAGEAEDHLRALRMLLRRVDGARWQRNATEGFCWYLASLGAVAVTAVLAGVTIAPETPAVPRLILLVGAGASTLGALLAAAPRLVEEASPWRAARILQREEPAFKNDLVAALEFGESLVDQPDASDEELGFGRALGAAHLERTLAELREATDDGDHFDDLLPERSLDAPLLATLATALLLAGAWGIWPDSTVRALRSPLAAATGDDANRRVRPVVGDLEIRYAPPSYTNKKPRERRNSTGRIEAVAGTEITISAFPLVEADTFEMVLATGDDERIVELDGGNGRRLSSSFVLEESGHYQFRARTEEDVTITDGRERKIEVTPDESPDVRITSHEGVVPVSPRDVLEIEFEARDDFGLRSISSVHHFSGSSDDKTRESIDVPALTDGPEEIDDTFEFELAPLELRPKDRVEFYLRAEDNNTRTGPGVAESDVLTLRVQSKRDKHLRALRRQKKLADQWLQVLGDYLANPIGDRNKRDDDSFEQTVPADASPKELADRAKRLAKTVEREAKVLEKMDDLLDRIDEDPLMSPRNQSIVTSLHDEFQELHERATTRLDDLESDGALPDTLEPDEARPLAEFSSDAEAAYEKGVLKMLELVASQKMESVKATRKEIDELKEELKGLLEKYKETKDPEMKKKIKRQIDRLRQRMQEMMQRMQTQIRDLPKRHLNKEALKQKKLESDTQGLSNNLESMEKKVEEGDIEGALEQLEKLDSNLGSLGKEMDQQFSQAQPKGLSKLDEQMSKLMDEVNNLKSAESQLEESTNKLKDEREEQRREEVDKMLESFRKRMKKKVDRQLEDFNEMADRDLPEQNRADLDSTRKELEKLKKRLERGDIQQSKESADEVLDKMQTLRFNLELGKRHADNEGEKSRASRSLQQLDEMKSRGKKVRDGLEKMMKRADRALKRSGGDKLRKLAQRQGRIEQKAKKLQKKMKEASKEVPSLEKRLKPKLDSAREQMKQARKRLEKGRAQGALDSERSALENLDELKQSMKQSMKRQQSKGKGGKQRRKEVEIPDDESEAEGEAIRREVMRGMKENKIEKYEKEIDRYYERLVQ